MANESGNRRNQSSDRSPIASNVDDANVLFSSLSTEASNTLTNDVASASKLLARLLDPTGSTPPAEYETYQQAFVGLKDVVVGIPDTAEYLALFNQEIFEIGDEWFCFVAYIYRMADYRVAYARDDDQKDQAKADKELLSQWCDSLKAYNDMLMDVEKQFSDGRIEIIGSLRAETEFTDERLRGYVQKLDKLWDQFREDLKKGTRKFRASMKGNEDNTLSSEVGDQKYVVDIEDGPLGRVDVKQLIRALRAQC